MHLCSSFGRQFLAMELLMFLTNHRPYNYGRVYYCQDSLIFSSLPAFNLVHKIGVELN
jgi:hypothetical protein